MGLYYSDTGPEEGILRYRDVSDPIAVFEAPEDSTPIGSALCIGWDAAGSAVWRLVVPDAEAEGRDAAVAGERGDGHRLVEAEPADAAVATAPAAGPAAARPDPV